MFRLPKPRSKLHGKTSNPPSGNIIRPSPSTSENFLHKQKASGIGSGPLVEKAVLQLNIPIFSGGLIDANVRTAYSQLRQAILNEQRTLRLVSEQVRTADENLAGSRVRLHDLHVEVAAAREAYRQAAFSYTAGLATNLDVLTAIDQVNSAELSLASEQLNLQTLLPPVASCRGQAGPPGFARSPIRCRRGSVHSDPSRTSHPGIDLSRTGIEWLVQHGRSVQFAISISNFQCGCSCFIEN